MATAPAAQRHYSAPCPGCGAPVAFRSAQSTHAICAYCHSTVLRTGDVLSRIGKMAELFEDHSLLQLLATGRWQQRNFTLIGRLQYQTDEGTWVEWNALFDDGSTGWLAEDNGAYVFSLALDSQRALPGPERFVVGARTAVNGQTYTVASKVTACLVSAQGELPKLPALGQPFAVVELRAETQVLSLDYYGQTPMVARGTAVLLEDLALSGLKEGSEKAEAGRQFNCPGCGAPVAVALKGSKSITCGSCQRILDLESGDGAALRAALQDEPIRPLIALGSTGTLQAVVWQVVGFVHRMGAVPGEDTQFGWSEYLLYNARRGFSFLVDSDAGWSLVRPITGAPTMDSRGDRSVRYLGAQYALKDSYDAWINYVCGEFYWRVERDQRTFNRDYVLGRRLLSLEQTPSEQVWSAGEIISSAAVAAAFGLQDQQELLQRGDVAPFSAAPSLGVGLVVVVLVALVVVLVLMARCSACDPRLEYCAASSGYRSSGGAYGGYTGGGGGHK